MFYVVTGGAGFIGSNIVAALEARGDGPIVVIDRMSNDRWLNIAKRSLHSIVAPRETFAFLASCPAETAVIHMGARTSTQDEDTDALLETNVRLTVDLFELCRSKDWPFLYASSAAVYGAHKDQSDDGVYRVNRQNLSPYAWSKLAADAMIAARSAAAPTLWAGLRLFNVYGPGEDHKGDMRSFPSKCFDAIRSGEPIKLMRGSDRFCRDWVYVDDVARLACDLVSPDSMVRSFRSGVYNVGTGAATSFNDVARACIETAGKIAPIETIPFPEAWNGRYQSHTCADTGKLMKALPYFRFTPLAEGLNLYWRQHASHDSMARRP